MRLLSTVLDSAFVDSLTFFLFLVKYMWLVTVQLGAGLRARLCYLFSKRELLFVSPVSFLNYWNDAHSLLIQESSWFCD